jgi:hypothetical protein
MKSKEVIMALRCSKCSNHSHWACYNCGIALCDDHIHKIAETEITSKIYCLRCFVKIKRQTSPSRNFEYR